MPEKDGWLALANKIPLGVSIVYIEYGKGGRCGEAHTFLVLRLADDAATMFSAFSTPHHQMSLLDTLRAQDGFHPPQRSHAHVLEMVSKAGTNDGFEEAFGCRPMPESPFSTTDDWHVLLEKAQVVTAPPQSSFTVFKKVLMTARLTNVCMDMDTVRRDFPKLF